MKKILFACLLLASLPLHAGPYADTAKAKFESEVREAIQLANMSKADKNKVIAELPGLQKILRNEARAGINKAKSCLKIKRDFVAEQKKLMESEDLPDRDFSASLVSAMGNYISMICLDLKR